MITLFCQNTASKHLFSEEPDAPDDYPCEMSLACGASVAGDVDSNLLFEEAPAEDEFI